RKVAGRAVAHLGKADALKLTVGFGEKLGLFAALKMQEAAQHACAAAQVCAKGRVLQRRHVREDLGVLEGAGDALPRDIAGAMHACRTAADADLAGAEACNPGDEVEGRALASAVRA